MQGHLSENTIDDTMSQRLQVWLEDLGVGKDTMLKIDEDLQLILYRHWSLQDAVRSWSSGGNHAPRNRRATLAQWCIGFAATVTGKSRLIIIDTMLNVYKVTVQVQVTNQ